MKNGNYCFSSRCKSCRHTANKTRYYLDIDKSRLRSRLIRSEYRKKRPDKVKDSFIKWKLTNREDYLKHKLNDYNKHKRAYLERRKLWGKNNPDQLAEIKRKSGNKRRAAKKKAQGVFTVQEWLDLKITYNNKCLCCGKSEPEIKLTADHIIPLSKEFSSNGIDNIQPLCKSCNSSKNARIIDYRPNGNIMKSVLKQ
jgi:5-methylcytosine-specific restriction endonuclease McrA